MSLPTTAHTTLTGVLVLAASLWLGGFCTLVVVSSVARQTLRTTDRVAFFRTLGRRYGLVSSTALLIGLAVGVVLLAGRQWTAQLVATAIVAGLLVIATLIGVAQAQRMTHLRRHALLTPRTWPWSVGSDERHAALPCSARRLEGSASRWSRSAFFLGHETDVSVLPTLVREVARLTTAQTVT